MKKQIISLLLIAVMAAMFLPTVAFANYYGTQWVYTDNGKSLNVRSTPSTGNNIIGSLKYGAEVTVVEMDSNGWAQILWEQNAYGEFGVAYVQRRFLVNHKPTSQPAQPSTVPASGGTAATADLAKAFSTMNDEFRTGKLVANPFTVYARPARASGWVNLRWAPSTEAERIATCPQGKALTVIGETKNWYQVRDPQTSMIGFIMKKFVSAN
jgi:uncharacterized protein YgiM (DUF1202 family)